MQDGRGIVRVDVQGNSETFSDFFGEAGTDGTDRIANTLTNGETTPEVDDAVVGRVNAHTGDYAHISFYPEDAESAGWQRLDVEARVEESDIHFEIWGATDGVREAAGCAAAECFESEEDGQHLLAHLQGRLSEWVGRARDRVGRE